MSFNTSWFTLSRGTNQTGPNSVHSPNRELLNPPETQMMPTLEQMFTGCPADGAELDPLKEVLQYAVGFALQKIMPKLALLETKYASLESKLEKIAQFQAQHNSFKLNDAMKSALQKLVTETVNSFILYQDDSWIKNKLKEMFPNLSNYAHDEGVKEFHQYASTARSNLKTFIHSHLSEPFPQVLDAVKARLENVDVSYDIKLKLAMVLLRAATIQIEQKEQRSTNENPNQATIASDTARSEESNNDLPSDAPKKKHGHRDPFWTEIEEILKTAENEEENSSDYSGGNLLNHLIGVYEERRSQCTPSKKRKRAHQD